MLDHQKSSASQLLRLDPDGGGQLDGGIQPELAVAVSHFEVHVRRLGPLVAEEEEPEALDEEQRRHAAKVARPLGRASFL